MATKKTTKKAPPKKAVKPAKKKQTTKAKKKTISWSNFGEWWEKVACRKVDKMERDWCKQNEPNDPEEDAGGDHWHVNEMMHSGDAHEMTYDIAEDIFNKGKNGEKWQMAQEFSLYCELDDVIMEAYEAGKKSK